MIQNICQYSISIVDGVTNQECITLCELNPQITSGEIAVPTDELYRASCASERTVLDLTRFDINETTACITRNRPSNMIFDEHSVDPLYAEDWISCQNYCQIDSDCMMGAYKAEDKICHLYLHQEILEKGFFDPTDEGSCETNHTSLIVNGHRRCVLEDRNRSLFGDYGDVGYYVFPRLCQRKSDSEWDRTKFLIESIDRFNESGYPIISEVSRKLYDQDGDMLEGGIEAMSEVSEYSELITGRTDDDIAPMYIAEEMGDGIGGDDTLVNDGGTDEAGIGNSPTTEVLSSTVWSTMTLEEISNEEDDTATTLTKSTLEITSTDETTIPPTDDPIIIVEASTATRVPFVTATDITPTNAATTTTTTATATVTINKTMTITSTVNTSEYTLDNVLASQYLPLAPFSISRATDEGSSVYRTPVIDDLITDERSKIENKRDQHRSGMLTPVINVEAVDNMSAGQQVQLENEGALRGYIGPQEAAVGMIVDPDNINIEVPQNVGIDPDNADGTNVKLIILVCVVLLLSIGMMVGIVKIVDVCLKRYKSKKHRKETLNHINSVDVFGKFDSFVDIRESHW